MTSPSYLQKDNDSVHELIRTSTSHTFNLVYGAARRILGGLALGQ